MHNMATDTEALTAIPARNHYVVRSVQHCLFLQLDGAEQAALGTAHQAVRAAKQGATMVCGPSVVYNC